MLNIIDAIEWELNQINRIFLMLKRDNTKPERLPIHSKRRSGHTYYYVSVVKSGRRRDEYLGKVNSERLLEVVRQSYKAELIKTLEANRNLLLKFKELYVPYSPVNIMGRLSPCLANYPFSGIFDKRLEEMEKWAHADYKRNSTPFPDRVTLAKDGTRVRSKSECIIYNMLLDAGFYFRYDPVLDLISPDPAFAGMDTIKSPDFQIMCMDGSTILIEHAGNLSKKWYSDDLARKLQLYHYNGYVPGVNMFITADDKDGGLDTESIAQLLETIRWKVYQ